MSQEEKVTQEVEVNQAAAAAEEPAVSPEAMLEQLRAMRRQIPEYVQLTPSEAAARRAAASVPADFTAAALSAIGTSPVVQVGVGHASEELQRDAELADRWTQVEEELRAMLRGVASANLARRFRVGRAALAAYAVSKGLVRNPEHADLLPHLETMRKSNRIGRRKSVPQPQPQPHPVSEPQA